MTAISAIAAQAAAASAIPPAPAPAEAAAATSVPFGDMLTNGLRGVEGRLDHADQMVRAFTLDDSVPVHDVTVALEQARLSLDLAMQVRTRLVDGFREIMNMQL